MSRSKSLNPRSTFNPPGMIGTDVRSACRGILRHKSAINDAPKAQAVKRKLSSIRAANLREEERKSRAAAKEEQFGKQRIAFA